VGRITLAGDGIAQVEGLPGCMTNELLRFEDGTLGLALNMAGFLQNQEFLTVLYLKVRSL
jgi:F0F1-type ATP synthase alpha subunit